VNKYKFKNFHNSKIPAIYKIYPDRITNPTQDAVDFNDLNNCLDRGFWNKFSSMINPVDLPREKGFVNNITSVNSKKCEFIQLVDVVMGGIGWVDNFEYSSAGPGCKVYDSEPMEQDGHGGYCHSETKECPKCEGSGKVETWF
jgi:hypothetical protein